MRLCPRCHTLHPDRELVCHSEICGATGTPLTGQQVVPAPIGRLQRTAGMDEDASRDDGIGALDDLSRDDALHGLVMADDASMDEETAAGARAPAVAGPARTAAMGPASKRAPAAPAPVPTPRKSARDSRAEDAIGRVLGSYKLLEVIGRGGMGRVYRAEHVKLGRHVALKLLKPEYAVKRDAVARFFQEAKAVNKIRHRNIVEVTDYVELDDGTTFIIMELLEGASLGKALRVGGPMEVARLLAILVQVCDALEAAHAVNIVHRDLKPDNIFLIQEEFGEVAKLLDFGVAKLLAADDSTSAEDYYQTAAGSVVGTPAYMSPEQAGGLDVDGRSDVYSLGAIMYELFCGQPLFRGRSFGDFVVKHMSEQPVPPRDTPGGAAMAPELEQIILRCLQKKPADRFSGAGELRDRLYQHLASIDSGLGVVMANPRMSGVRSMGGTGPVRIPRATGPVPLIQATPQPGAGAVPSESIPLTSVPGGGLTPVPRVPLADSSDNPSSNMVAGDLQGSPPSSARKRRATWPLWAAGAGAVAVTAFLLATGIGHDPVAAPEPAASTPPLPVPAVLPPPAAPRPPAPIKLAVRTDPVGADVYIYGSDESQCRTPCELTIDPSDGGSTVKRVFVLKRPGFQDYQLEVPLQGHPPPDAFVILMPEGDSDEPGAGKPPEEPPAVEHESEKSGHIKLEKHTPAEPAPSEASAAQPSKPEPKAEPQKPEPKAEPQKPEPKAEPETAPDKPAEPSKSEPPQPKKKDRIDRTDTLDPFGNK